MDLFTVPINTRFGSRLACVISSPVLSFFLSFLCYVPHKLCKVAVRECGGEKMDAATLSRSILSALQSLRLRSEKWRGCNRGITLRLPPKMSCCLSDLLLSTLICAAVQLLPWCLRAFLLCRGPFLWFAGVCVWLFFMVDTEVKMKWRS